MIKVVEYNVILGLIIGLPTVAYAMYNLVLCSLWVNSRPTLWFRIVVRFTYFLTTVPD